MSFGFWRQFISVFGVPMNFGFWRQFISVLWIYADWVGIVWVVFGSFLQHSRLLPCKPIHRLISVYTLFDVSHGNEVLCGLITEVKLSISVNDLSQLAQGFWVSFCQTYGFILSLLYTSRDDILAFAQNIFHFSIHRLNLTFTIVYFIH